MILEIYDGAITHFNEHHVGKRAVSYSMDFTVMFLTASKENVKNGIETRIILKNNKTEPDSPLH